MKIDGMLGLAPGSGSTFNKGFIKELYNQQTIRKNMFSLYLSDQSYIWFGGYDYSFIRTLNGNNLLSDNQIENLIQWIDIDDSSDSSHFEA